MASPQTVRNNVYSYDMRDLRLLASQDPDKFSQRQVEVTFIYNGQRTKFMGLVTVEEHGILVHHSPVGANPIYRPDGLPLEGLRPVSVMVPVNALSPQDFWRRPLHDEEEDGSY